tara:strand:+ start:822 stop:2195 length:1374 start_codon:yes stop_codon:yes gene_type:complete
MKDPGSFRDPSGYVYLENNKIFRVVNISYKENYRLLIDSGLYKELVKKELLIKHSEVDKTQGNKQYCTLKVDKIFPINYPYEWSFSQLRDAAVLTLEIQKIAVKYGMTLKDATPYNVQFNGHKPIFIDTLSFEKIIDENYAWVAYKQFCEMFLSPLCLMSYEDPSLNKLLIPFLDGIPLNLTNKLLKFKHKIKPSIFINLVLPNIITPKVNSGKGSSRKKISQKQHLNIVEQLLSFSSQLEVLKEESEWGEYNSETILEKEVYVIEKEKAIEEFLKDKNYKIVWDIGSNDGFYSRKLCALTQSHVMSLDIDWQCVEKNYVINKKKEQNKVTPILFDLSNPSPGIGWMNNERTDIFSRIGEPNLICLFAVMHHVLNKNIPLEFLMDLIVKSESDVLIEYVPFTDPKCQIIFESRSDDFYYPGKGDFENRIKENFEVQDMRRLKPTDRILYFLKKRKIN